MPRPQESFRFNAIGKEFSQIFESLKNRNFAALFFYSLLFGAAAGLSTALYLYITRFFFEFTGAQIGITGVAVLVAPFIAWPLAPKLGLILGKKVTAISLQLARLAIYPIPFICVLLGYWPALGSTASIAIYTAFIFTEVALFIVSAVMLDSMMADVVEDSEKRTNRRSEGLFFAARSFAGKFVSASGIISAGLIISAVGFDSITSVADFTAEHRLELAQLFLPAYCSLILGAIACISLYQIDRTTHEQNIKLLSERLAAEKSDTSDFEKT
jgi:Na+/melibiose symporter-like transporter